MPFHLAEKCRLNLTKDEEYEISNQLFWLIEDAQEIFQDSDRVVLKRKCLRYVNSELRPNEYLSDAAKPNGELPSRKFIFKLSVVVKNYFVDF